VTLIFTLFRVSARASIRNRADRCMNNQRHERHRVTRAIELALAKIAEKNPELARLLRERIKTGTFLSYMPVPPLSAPGRKRATTPPSSRKSPIRH